MLYAAALDICQDHELFKNYMTYLFVAEHMHNMKIYCSATTPNKTYIPDGLPTSALIC